MIHNVSHLTEAQQQEMVDELEDRFPNIRELNSSIQPQSVTASRTRGGHSKRVTRVVFTLNNYTPEEYEQVKCIPAKWMVVAKETGDLNDTPHLQGAIILKSQKAFSTLKNLPGLARAHFEEMHGSPQQSLDYCTKQDKHAYVIGTLPQQGKRSDIHDVVDRLKEGVSMNQLVQDTSSAVCFVRYSRGLTLLRQHYNQTRDPNTPPRVFWFYGPTGTCKTRTAFRISELQKKTPVWISNGPLKWFDGYDGHPTAIFDDLRTSDTTFPYLLRLLDRYPIQVEFKGGYSNWAPGTIFITCPKSPRDLWSLRTEEQLDQLSRRITKEVSFPPVLGDILSLGEFCDLSQCQLQQLFREFWPGNGLGSQLLCRQDATVNPTTVALQHSNNPGQPGCSEGNNSGSQSEGNGLPNPLDGWPSFDDEEPLFGEW